MSAAIIHHWNPEDPVFWERQGEAVALRNLWLSIPALALSFAVWMLWSVVVVHLPAAGFRYSTNQLFWLTALPALCGATLRIFYAFAVPVIPLSCALLAFGTCGLKLKRKLLEELPMLNSCNSDLLFRFTCFLSVVMFDSCSRRIFHLCRWNNV
jgi:hypothetical protein